MRRDPRIDPQVGDVLRAKAPGFAPGLQDQPVRVRAVTGELVGYAATGGEPVWVTLLHWREQVVGADVLHAV